jgi:hypothetical protein
MIYTVLIVANGSYDELDKYLTPRKRISFKITLRKVERHSMEDYASIILNGHQEKSLSRLNRIRIRSKGSNVECLGF